MTPDPEYLTQLAAAHLKHVSRGAVQQAIRRGELDTVRIGPYRMILANAKFRAWDINRTKQRHIRRGFRRRRAKSRAGQVAGAIPGTG